MSNQSGFRMRRTEYSDGRRPELRTMLEESAADIDFQVKSLLAEFRAAEQIQDAEQRHRKLESLRNRSLGLRIKLMSLRGILQQA